MTIYNEWTAKIASLEAEKEALEIIIQSAIEATGADIPYGDLPGEIDDLKRQLECAHKAQREAETHLSKELARIAIETDQRIRTAESQLAKLYARMVDAELLAERRAEQILQDQIKA